jgi:hypothetical protein
MTYVILDINRTPTEKNGRPLAAHPLIPLFVILRDNKKQ